MTTIEWTDVAVNPIRARNTITGTTGWHCEHVSEGCRHCYAEWRNLHPMYGKPFAGTKVKYMPVVLHSRHVEVYFDEKVLRKVLGMRKPQRVFWCSMTDIFGHWVTDAMLDQCFAVMALTPHLTHIILTKRPERMQAYLSYEHTPARVTGQMFNILDAKGVSVEDEKRKWPELFDSNGFANIPVKWPLPNVWAGVSVSNQDDANKFVPILLETPAAVRFVSYEPALAAVDFWTWLGNQDAEQDTSAHAIWRGELPGLDLIICGGESGAKARPMHPDYPRKVRDDCVAAGVAFFFKQWGAWQHGSGDKNNKIVLTDGTVISNPTQASHDQISEWAKLNPTCMAKVGKKKAGRVLDGRTWDELPGVGG